MVLKCYTLLDFFTKIRFSPDPIKYSISTQSISKTQDSQRFRLSTKNFDVKSYLTKCFDDFLASLETLHHLKCPVMTKIFSIKSTIRVVWNTSNLF